MVGALDVGRNISALHARRAEGNAIEDVWLSRRKSDSSADVSAKGFLEPEFSGTEMMSVAVYPELDNGG